MASPSNRQRRLSASSPAGFSWLRWGGGLFSFVALAFFFAFDRQAASAYTYLFTSLFAAAWIFGEKKSLARFWIFMFLLGFAAVYFLENPSFEQKKSLLFSVPVVLLLTCGFSGASMIAWPAAALWGACCWVGYKFYEFCTAQGLESFAHPLSETFMIFGAVAAVGAVVFSWNAPGGGRTLLWISFWCSLWALDLNMVEWGLPLAYGVIFVLMWVLHVFLPPFAFGVLFWAVPWMAAYWVLWVLHSPLEMWAWIQWLFSAVWFFRAGGTRGASFSLLQLTGWVTAGSLAASMLAFSEQIPLFDIKTTSFSSGKWLQQIFIVYLLVGLLILIIRGFSFLERRFRLPDVRIGFPVFALGEREKSLGAAIGWGLIFMALLFWGGTP